MGLSPALGAESLLLPSMLAPCFPVPSQLGPLHGQWAGAGERPWGREGTGLVVTCCEGVLPRGCSSGDHVVPRHPSAALATPDLPSLLWIPLELLPGPGAVARVLGCAQGLLCRAQELQPGWPQRDAGQQRSGAWPGKEGGTRGARIHPSKAPVTLCCVLPPASPPCSQSTASS